MKMNFLFYYLNFEFKTNFWKGLRMFFSVPIFSLTHTHNFAEDTTKTFTNYCISVLSDWPNHCVERWSLIHGCVDFYNYEVFVRDIMISIKDYLYARINIDFSKAELSLIFNYNLTCFCLEKKIKNFKQKIETKSANSNGALN